MVEKTKPLAILFAIALLAVLIGATIVSAAETPTVTETYVVNIDDVGNGHVTDTIKYSKADYQDIKKVHAEKRGFLTRRFTTEDYTGELHDFKTTMDDVTNSVVITYEKPGLAYNTTGKFMLYGYPDKPKSEDDRKFVFEDTSTVNSEFTLFTDQKFKTTTEVVLPGAATDARYDEEEKAITYDMPPARTLYGFLSEQKTLMSGVFAIVFLLFAGLLGYVWTRKPVEPAVAAGPVQAVAPAQAPPVGKARPPAGHKFCEQCGTKLLPGQHFCESCGAKVD